MAKKVVLACAEALQETTMKISMNEAKTMNDSYWGNNLNFIRFAGLPGAAVFKNGL